MSTDRVFDRSVQEATFDAVWAAFEWAVVTAGTVVFTGAGVRFEEIGRAALAAADLQQAGVDFAFAAVIFVWGLYLLGYRQVLPRTLAAVSTDAN